IVLPSGKKWEYPIYLPLLPKLKKGILVSYHLKGYLRPRLIKIGQKVYSRYIPLGPEKRIWVYPPSQPLLSSQGVFPAFLSTLEKLVQKGREGEKLKRELNNIDKKLFTLRLDLRKLSQKNKELYQTLSKLIEKEEEKEAKLKLKLAKVVKEVHGLRIKVFYFLPFLEKNKKIAILNLGRNLERTHPPVTDTLVALLTFLTNQEVPLSRKEWIERWKKKKKPFQKG
ncbi:MAG: hypothetical protein D6785_08705, partial [Planctomycetota bacterium]